MNPGVTWAILSLCLLVLLTGCDGPTRDGGLEVVGPSIWDLGRHPAREPRTASFRIRNGGHSVLSLQFRKTCVCTEVYGDRTALAPGDETDVDVTILENSIRGSYLEKVYVKTVEGRAQFLCLSVMGEAVPLVEVTPSDHVYAGRIAGDVSWSQRFRLQPTEPGVVFGAPTQTGTHATAVVLFPDPEDSAGGCDLDVRVDPAGVRGDYRGTIRVPVMAPPGHAPVEIGITGRIGTEFCIVPGVALLGASGTPVSRVFQLRLLGTSDQRLDTNRVTVPSSAGVSFSGWESMDERTASVTVTFEAEFISGLEAGERVLSFGLPGVADGPLICRRGGRAWPTAEGGK